MITVDSVEEDIMSIMNYSITNPRRFYYSSKVYSSIRKGFDSGELSKEESDSLLLRYREAILNSTFFNRKVIKAFKAYYRTGGNILSSINLVDIIKCRRSCKTLIDFYEKGGVNSLCSSVTLGTLFRKIKIDFYKLSKSDTSTNEFYDSLFIVENIMWTGLFFEDLTEEIQKFSEEFFEIRRKFLEIDKKFYYQPDGELTTMANSSQFTSKETEDLNSTGYLAYHKEKYTIELLALIYKNPFDKVGCTNKVKDMIENSNLTSDSKLLLKSIIISTMDDYHRYQVADVLDSIESGSVYNICYFYKSVFDETYKFSVEFCKYMSDEKLIELCITYACVYALAEDVIGNRYDMMKVSLKASLDSLVENEIITVGEENKIIEDTYRRISRQWKRKKLY